MNRGVPQGRPLGVLAGPALLLSALFALPALGHGFGQRFDLPVPLDFYLVGAAATVALSFAIIAFFVRRGGELHAYPRLDLLRWRVTRFLTRPAVVATLQTSSVVVFVVSLLAGIRGAQDPAHNVLPTLVWITWWTGLAYVSAVFGDLWGLINPWKILFDWAESLHDRLRPRGRFGLDLAYPDWLGVWPAFLLFLAFVWGELVWERNAIPADLASAALIYSAVTWIGMFVFGKNAWLRGGECFNIVFGLLARFSPTEVRVLDPTICGECSSAECRAEMKSCVNCYECHALALASGTNHQWNLRPYSVGLLTDQLISPSKMAFVLLMLATVSFDGFMATPLWKETFDGITSARTLMPFLHRVNMMGMSVDAIVATLGLAAAPLLFLGVYLFFGLLMALAAGSGDKGPGGSFSAMSMARTFVLSLIPIAIAYHLSHYLSFLLVAGQLIIPLASDPFGYGWNLFGTADYGVNVGIIGARFVWYASVAAVVAGHIVAVYLAHVLALRVFETRRSALRSQYPMLVLMVFYTFASLWILAQPIVD